MSKNSQISFGFYVSDANSELKEIFEQKIFYFVYHEGLCTTFGISSWSCFI